MVDDYSKINDVEGSELLLAGHAIVKNGVVFDIAEKLWQAEEFDACMMAMDDLGVPRQDESGAVYSVFGRACWMADLLKDR
jgi:hypothetical protein